MQDIFKSIYDLFTAAPTPALNTNLGARLYNNNAPHGTTLPYGVFFLVSGDTDYNFTSTFDIIDIQFSLFSQADEISEILTLYENLKTLYDDCTLTVANHEFHKMERNNSWLNKDADINSNPGRIYTINYAAYLQDEMRFIDDKLNLTIGLRFDEYEGFDAEFSPRVGLVFNPIEELTFKMLGGKAFKPPTFRQNYMVRIDGKSPGNPDVGPERITTFETELGYNIDNNIIARINYFNNTLTDFIESINYATYSNSSDKRKISGIELDLRTEGTFGLNLIDSFSIFSIYSYKSLFYLNFKTIPIAHFLFSHYKIIHYMMLYSFFFRYLRYALHLFDYCYASGQGDILFPFEIFC